LSHQGWHGLKKKKSEQALKNLDRVSGRVSTCGFDGSRESLTIS